MKLNPTEFDWTPATENVDPDPTDTVPAPAFNDAEVTGFQIGIRSLSSAGSAPGTYPVVIEVADPKATKETLSAAYASGLALLKDDQYQSAIRSIGPVDSDWSPETDASAFEIKAPLPVPKPPSGFTAQ